MDLHLSNFETAKERLIEQVRAHSFLRRCREGVVTLDELKIFLVQQGIYSSYFTRYLCALMANLPDNSQVQRLAENLLEEMGLTADSATPHSTVYRSMLRHFDLSLEGARPLVGTRRLIDAMFDHCRDPRPVRGLGALCLGAEALVSSIYADVIVGFERCGAPAAALQFFRLHVECDDAHAQTMRDMLVEIGQADPEQFEVMLAAGQAMVDARIAFFRSIECSHDESMGDTGGAALAAAVG